MFVTFLHISCPSQISLYLYVPMLMHFPVLLLPSFVKVGFDIAE